MTWISLGINCQWSYEAEEEDEEERTRILCNNHYPDQALPHVTKFQNGKWINKCQEIILVILLQDSRVQQKFADIALGWLFIACFGKHIVSIEIQVAFKSNQVRFYNFTLFWIRVVLFCAGSQYSILKPTNFTTFLKPQIILH